MINGIALFGLNGGGKSTLAHALAKRIGYFEIDVEDYYFPEQRKSRKWAMEHDEIMVTEHLGDVPFSTPRTKEEVQDTLLKDMQSHQKFIISGVTMNWKEDILSRIDIAFWVQTPLEERLKRIKMREEKRFGERVLPGGDMYAQQIEFQKVVGNRDIKKIEESAQRLKCPIIVLDGTVSVEENLEKIIKHIDR